MGRMWLIAGVLCGVMVGGCGVPREAGELAAQEEAVLGAVAGGTSDDAAVRGALAAQADAWEAMAALVERREFLGTAVGADFVELVTRTAAPARRQRELIAQGQDDPGLNRETLAQLRQIWADAQRYLGE